MKSLPLDDNHVLRTFTPLGARLVRIPTGDGRVYTTINELKVECVDKNSSKRYVFNKVFTPNLVQSISIPNFKVLDEAEAQAKSLINMCLVAGCIDLDCWKEEQ